MKVKKIDPTPCSVPQRTDVLEKNRFYLVLLAQLSLLTCPTLTPHRQCDRCIWCRGLLPRSMRSRGENGSSAVPWLMLWVLSPGLSQSSLCFNQCWSDSGLGLGLNGWVRVRTRVRTRTLPLWTRTRTPPLWTRTQALWTRTLALWTRTRTPPRWTRTHSESRWVRWEMFKANLNFHVQ